MIRLSTSQLLEHLCTLSPALLESNLYKLCLDYTKGFDGSGRPNIEDDANTIQTLQYGARNDAWSSIEDLFVELEYGQKSSDSELVVGELISLIQKVTLALDAYLSLAPAADVEQASVIKSRR